MMEMGQPLHAFDFDRLREHRIVVRCAKQGEWFSTLDGEERFLFDDTLLICDGQGTVALAGIMGGLDSEITPETTRVLIESAYFQPQSIRRSSRKLGLRTEASFRFERSVDPQGVIRALDRTAQLMHEVGGGVVAKGRLDVYPSPIDLPTLTLRVDRTNRFLGTEIEADEMARVLRSIELEVESINDNHLRVTPPYFRQDITREVDVAEEVARLVGYDQIPTTYPQAAAYSMPDDPHRRMREQLKDALKGLGFFELLTYSFISSHSLQKLRLPSEDPRLHPVKIRNPLSEEQAVMRTTLVPGLIQTVGHNFDHQNENLKLFELSKVFLPRGDETLPEERYHLAGVMTGKRYPHPLYSNDEEVDYADIKGAVESILDFLHLKRRQFVPGNLPSYMDPLGSASIVCNGEQIGVLGRLYAEIEESFDLKKPVMLFELDLDRVFALKHPPTLFQPLPRFPAVIRDIALIVHEDLPIEKPLNFILNEQESFLEGVEIFDLYRSPKLGEGKKSVGYRLTYRAADRSLTDEEVNDIHDKLVEKVLNVFQATLR
jgi:phenylalanyl-tRNA synthetase beta chain